MSYILGRINPGKPCFGPGINATILISMVSLSVAFPALAKSDKGLYETPSHIFVP